MTAGVMVSCAASSQTVMDEMIVATAAALAAALAARMRSLRQGRGPSTAAKCAIKSLATLDTHESILNSLHWI